jgi:hypothetical protein
VKTRSTLAEVSISTGGGGANSDAGFMDNGHRIYGSFREGQKVSAKSIKGASKGRSIVERDFLKFKEAQKPTNELGWKV